MRQLYYTMILLLSFSMSSFAQPKPLLTEGKKWECVMTGDSPDFTTTLYYYYSITVGEEVENNGKIYRKMYGNYDDATLKENPSLKNYTFLAYEKNGKIYEAGEGTDYLMMDFNLRKGDKLDVRTSEEGDAVNGYSVIDEDTIIVKGRSYRRMRIGYNGNTSSYWVEGIGAAQEMFMTLFPSSFYGLSSMISCYENGECIFTKDDFNATATSVQSAKEDAKGECELYDIMGRKVSKPGKGKVFISKGKKHIAF